ncbi:MAG TPA: hypothetical protein VFR61_09265 [Nitrososphaeraceae archaeon]|nr:hypothetical protein [Nitrososphaeraceae archaeon]
MDGAEARRILDEYFPKKKRFVGRNYSTTKYNIIGFGFENITEYRHCPLDPGVRLIKIKGDLKCPTCGYTYKKEEVPNEEGVTIKHNKQQTAIISGKGKRKYYDKSGNEINDPDLIQDIQQGANVISYREELPK